MHGQVITSTRVFDGERILEDTSVRIVSGTVERVGKLVEPRPDDTVYDGRGKTLMPGLIDCHVHSGPTTTTQALMFGVTTELDMNSLPSWMDPLRAAGRNRPDVADILSSSTGLTVRGGHPTQMIPSDHLPDFPVVESPNDVAEFVDARLAEGADYIKVYLEDGQLMGGQSVPSVTRRIIEQAVVTAHDRGRLVVAHALKRKYAQVAVDAGVDGLVHLFVDEPIDDGILDLMQAQSTFVVPTLTTLGSLTSTRAPADLADDPRVAPYLTPEWSTNLRQVWPENGSGARFETALESLSTLHSRGVTILAGSDAARAGRAPGSAHGVSLHDELRLLVSCGLSPLDALSCATSTPAQVFGLTDRGYVRPGMRADLVMVDGNPTESIDDTLSITNIWRGGVVLDREHQVRLLTEAVR